MSLTAKQAVAILCSLEGEFVAAAHYAADLQATVRATTKAETGTFDADVVTDGDLKVQERVLKILAATQLRSCRMLAEENTSSTALFASESELVITLDPIDGTGSYAQGGDFFGIVVGLHDATTLWYTFNYLPRFDWTVKIVGTTLTMLGQPPRFDFNDERIIVASNNLFKKNNAALGRDLERRGYLLRRKRELSPDSGATTIFMAGAVGGYYIENPATYDGLRGLHYAQALGYQVVSGGPKGEFDFSLVETRPLGTYHPGYYLVLKS